MSPASAFVLGMALGAFGIVTLQAIRNAPRGWQDTRGFHYARRADDTPPESETDEADCVMAEAPARLFRLPASVN